MKNSIALAVILASIGSASFAFGGHEELPTSLKRQIVSLVPGADVNDLSTGQISAIHSALRRNDSTDGGFDLPNTIKSILDWE